MLPLCIDITPLVRPRLNKDVFPVDRPSGFKRVNWNYFFHIFLEKKKNPQKVLYIVVIKKMTY